MRQILLSCTLLALLALPAAASAGSSAQGKPGFLVVRKAAGDGGVNGDPVATLIIQGFVLGRVSQEAQVDIIQLPSPAGQGAPQVRGDVRTKAIKWRPQPTATPFTGKRYTGSNFRFRAMGGYYRVVVRGSGVYLFAGGQCSSHVKCHVKLQGSSHYPRHDGEFSVNGGRFRSLPERPLTRQIGGG